MRQKYLKHNKMQKGEFEFMKLIQVQKCSFQMSQS